MVNEYPWMVALGKPKSRVAAKSESEQGSSGNKTFPQDPEYYGCGATLISQEWVVTASHCIFTKPDGSAITPSDVTVILGQADFRFTTETNILKVFEVSEIITHPGYNGATFQNDIALMKLATKADLNIYTPACLPTQGLEFVGQTGWVYGWGVTTAPTRFNVQLTANLLEVSVNVVSDESCKTALGSEKILDGMVCAGGVEGKDACQGDSGGPFTVPGGTNNQHTLVGVVSWGDGCAQAGKPGVYAEVSYFRDWLQTTIDANGGGTLYTP